MGKIIFSKKNWDVTDTYEKDEEIEREISEEKRIMNMTKGEYRKYNKKLKKEINTLKRELKGLSQGNNSKINSSLNDSSLNTNRTNYSTKFFVPNDKKKNINKNIDTKKLLKKDDSNNIFLSARNLDLQTDFNKILPSINSLIVDKKENRDIKNKTIISFKAQSIKNKFVKEKNKKQSKINQINKYLPNRIDNYEFPFKEIESYFKRYSNRNTPLINGNVGNNFFGFLGEFQKRVKEKSTGDIIKGNDYIKYDINKKNYITNKNKKDIIENFDRKINYLNFTMSEKLFGKNNDELLNN